MKKLWIVAMLFSVIPILSAEETMFDLFGKNIEPVVATWVDLVPRTGDCPDTSLGISPWGTPVAVSKTIKVKNKKGQDEWTTATAVETVYPATVKCTGNDEVDRQEIFPSKAKALESKAKNPKSTRWEIRPARVEEMIQLIASEMDWDIQMGNGWMVYSKGEEPLETRIIAIGDTQAHAVRAACAFKLAGAKLGESHSFFLGRYDVVDKDGRVIADGITPLEATTKAYKKLEMVAEGKQK